MFINTKIVNKIQVAINEIQLKSITFEPEWLLIGVTIFNFFSLTFTVHFLSI